MDNEKREKAKSIVTKAQIDISKLMEELFNEVDASLTSDLSLDNYYKIASDLIHVRNSIENTLINVETLLLERNKKWKD